MSSTELSPTRHKLGLALAGGGFRASLFHLGVLHRLAELDLLRYVEVLSTVSGGSIIGALYALLLKKYLERVEGGRLSRDDYIRLVEELRGILVRGIQKNLRTRLFLNPLGILRVLLTPRSLGQRMARLYERYIYRGILPDREREGWWARLIEPGRIRLRDIRIAPGGKAIEGGIETYNRQVVEAAISRSPDHGAEPRSAVTKLVLNATSLNSGARFWFSTVELGDWFLGHFRADEFEHLLVRKALLEPRVALAQLADALAAQGDPVAIEGEVYPRRSVSLARWWRQRVGRARRTGEPAPDIPAGWEPLFDVVPEFPGRLPTTAFGRLRLAKLHAWYLREGPRYGVSGGVPRETHWKRFWDELERIDESLAGALRRAVADDAAQRDLLLAFVLELYYLRSAAVMSQRILRDWNDLSLGDAVGASACFPPVFPPFQVYGFYDDWYVSRLGLTDGGVFDNVGLTALLDEECSHIIASDTGGLFETVERASTGRAGMMGRVANILMADVGWKQRDLVHDRRRVSGRITAHLAKASHPDEEWRRFQEGWAVHSLAFFHIGSFPVELAADGAQSGPPPLEPPVEGTALARMRTDLDGFGDAEVAALVNHGYLMADRYVRRYLKDAPYRHAEHWQRAPQLPLPVPADARLRKIVRAGRSRLGRSLQLGAGLSWAVTVLAGAALAVAVWVMRDDPVSVVGALQWLAAQAARGLESAVPVPVAGWTERAWPLGPAALVLGGAAAAFVVIRRVIRFSPTDWLEHRGFLRGARWVARLATGARGAAGNLLWPLGGAPVWIALGSAVSAGISYVFFHLPFMRATRKTT